MSESLLNHYIVGSLVYPNLIVKLNLIIKIFHGRKLFQLQSMNQTHRK